MVRTTSGQTYVTDSTGTFHIQATDKDSIYFLYGTKPTQKFAVKQISDQSAFDISLPVRIREKYKVLKEVVIYSKNYRQDSIENREQYTRIFNYHKPGIASSFSPGTPPGLDIDELFSIFQFRKNKHNIAFQKRLIEQEQESYVNSKFNSPLLKRITGLSGVELVQYKNLYRPPYEFLVNSSQVQFYEYILNSSYEFKRISGQ